MKVKIAAIIVLIGAAVVSLVISTSGEASHPHYKLQELHAMLAKPGAISDNRYMTVYGKVKEGTIQKSGAEANFTIFDGATEMNVYFTGKTLLPDTFKDGADAALDGRYDAASNRFIADKAMAKCASKYEAAGSEMKLGHPDNLKKYSSGQ
ncbi:MAG: cytochrome c maturation protein CcmE [Leptospiraceae bacterium]|nr:cytochrome c maturation protein CcmE [Leptospiraceae bacterium]